MARAGRWDRARAAGARVVVRDGDRRRRAGGPAAAAGRRASSRPTTSRSRPPCRRRWRPPACRWPSRLRYEPDPEFLGAPFVAMPFVSGAIPDQFTAADPWLAGLPDDAARRTVWASFLRRARVDPRAPASTGSACARVWTPSWPGGTEYVGVGHRRLAAGRAGARWWRGAAANRPDRRAAGVAPVGRRAARQRRVRPRDLPAAGGPRLGHGVASGRPRWTSRGSSRSRGCRPS